MKEITRKNFDRLRKRSELEYETVARKMRIAAQIDDAMKEKGVSKSELAKMMGKQQSEITKWLSGTHNFTTDILSEISMALGTEINGAKETPKHFFVENYMYKRDIPAVEMPTDKKYRISRRNSRGEEIPITTKFALAYYGN